jgi:predicted RNA binding protein YcfA (HicA-like mRNA interferase family)
MPKTTFFSQVVDALKSAGFELVRKNNSHFIYQNGARRNIVVPAKMEDPLLAKRLIKRANNG